MIAFEAEREADTRIGTTGEIGGTEIVTETTRVSRDKSLSLIASHIMEETNSVTRAGTASTVMSAPGVQRGCTWPTNAIPSRIELNVSRTDSRIGAEIETQGEGIGHFSHLPHNASTRSLPTPINLSRLTQLLQGYEESEARFILNGFEQGFSVGYRG